MDSITALQQSIQRLTRIKETADEAIQPAMSAYISELRIQIAKMVKWYEDEERVLEAELLAFVRPQRKVNENVSNVTENSSCILHEQTRLDFERKMAQYDREDQERAEDLQKRVELVTQLLGPATDSPKQMSPSNRSRQDKKQASARGNIAVDGVLHAKKFASLKLQQKTNALKIKLFYDLNEKLMNELIEFVEKDFMSLDELQTKDVDQTTLQFEKAMLHRKKAHAQFLLAARKAREGQRIKEESLRLSCSQHQREKEFFASEMEKAKLLEISKARSRQPDPIWVSNVAAAGMRKQQKAKQLLLDKTERLELRKEKTQTQVDGILEDQRIAQNKELKSKECAVKRFTDQIEAATVDLNAEHQLMLEMKTRDMTQFNQEMTELLTSIRRFASDVSEKERHQIREQRVRAKLAGQ